jgi:phage terminase large subunit-like protein
VIDIQHGHWGVRETALRIVQTCADLPGCRLGIEQGALKEAVSDYLEEYMRTFGRYFTPEPLRHNNQRKVDRITWALQGRSERHKINLVKAEWNDWLLAQISDFPDPLSHDDGIDALAYTDQLAQANFVGLEDVPDWEPTDIDAGY